MIEFPRKEKIHDKLYDRLCLFMAFTSGFCLGIFLRGLGL